MKTKNLLLFIILCINNIIITGQGVVKREVFPTNLEVYQGAWEYISENEIFRIFLKIGKEDSMVSFGPCIIGDYFYSKNNVVIDNYVISEIPTIDNNLTHNSVIINASNGKYESVKYANPNELYMFFYDKQRKKRVASGKIQLISSTQIRWILKDDEGVYTSDEKWVESGFSVPTDVIMTKKEQLLVR